MERLAFYCVCDRTHFLGLVALVNSLRLVGHHEPIYVLDCGLDAQQRRLLDPETALEAAERDLHPVLLKNVLPRRRPADVMVVVDVDVIFTRRIDGLVELARREEKPIFFLNDRTDRFHPEWEELGFGPPVRHDYLAVGQYVLPAAAGLVFLELFDEALLRLDVSKTLVNPSIRPSDPFYYPEMDVFNALIGTAIPFDGFTLANRDLVAYWPFTGLRVEDERTLACVDREGNRPALLHHILDKPWLAPVPASAFTRLMTRLLCGPDVAIRVPRSLIPRRLRSGPAGGVARRSLPLRAWSRDVARRTLSRRRSAA